jgi:hypothetical protein
MQPTAQAVGMVQEENASPEVAKENYADLKSILKLGTMKNRYAR